MAVAAALPYIAAAATAAGTGLEYYNASETNKKQQNSEVQAIQAQAEKQKQATGRVQNQINTVAKSTPASERAAATQGFITNLRQNKAISDATTPTLAGNASKRYNTDVAASTGAASDYSSNLADSMAGVVAPQRQRMDEGQGFQNTATDVGGIQQAAQRQSFVDQLRTKSIVENPWMSLGSKVLQGVGTAASLGAGAGLGATGAATSAATTGTSMADWAGSAQGAAWLNRFKGLGSAATDATQAVA